MIYYIYKVRRKQTSIRSSRSALPHRYLRSISWISWVRGHRPQPSTSWVAGAPVPQFAAAPIPQGRGSCARPYLCFHPEDRQTPSGLSSRKRKQLSFLFSRIFACRSSCVALPASFLSHLLLATHPRPVHRLPSRRFLRPSHKQKNAGPQHCAANPLITFIKRAQKSVDLPLKKAHVGTPGLHALAAAARTYSLTARIHYYPFSFLKEKKKENRSKFSRFKSNARFLTTFETSRWTRLSLAPRPLKNM